MSISAPEEPRAVRVETTAGELVVHLEDGRTVHVPLDWFPRLRDASAADLADWRLIGCGVGISWPKLDEDRPFGGSGFRRRRTGPLQAENDENGE